VERAGWVLEAQPAPDEIHVYVPPQRDGRRTLVNPDWPKIFAGDAIFRCLQRDLGISAATLLELMSDHR
jgi:hypothetical protein